MRTRQPPQSDGMVARTISKWALRHQQGVLTHAKRQYCCANNIQIKPTHPDQRRGRCQDEECATTKGIQQARTNGKVARPMSKWPPCHNGNHRATLTNGRVTRTHVEISRHTARITVKMDWRCKKNVLLWFQPLFCRGVSSIAPATTPHHAKLEINNYCNNSLFLTWCQHINRFFSGHCI